MKKIITILILIFSLQTPSQADDISEFQIEGMYIGSSALDYISEEQIQKNITPGHYNDETFTVVQNAYMSFFKTNDAVDFDYKTSDQNYTIHALSGVLIYENNIKECYEKMDEIVLDMMETFRGSAKKSKKREKKHSADKSGKSIVTMVSFWFDNGDRASVTCYDYSEDYHYYFHLEHLNDAFYCFYSNCLCGYCADDYYVESRFQ